MAGKSLSFDISLLPLVAGSNEISATSKSLGVTESDRSFIVEVTTGGLIYTLSETGDYYIVTGYDGTGLVKNLILNSLYQGAEDEAPKPVKAIGTNAFANSALETITIPSSIISIGSRAFMNSKNLTSVRFDDPSAPPTVPIEFASGVFAGCDNLENVELSVMVETVGNQMFKDCVSISKIVLPSSVKAIGDSAFSGCTALSSITIPEATTTIGLHAFYNCASLTSITIPSKVTYIGSSAFGGCTALTSVEFHDQFVWFAKHPDSADEYGDRIPAASFDHNGVMVDMLTSENILTKLDQMPAPELTLNKSDGTLMITDATGIAETFNIYVNDRCVATVDASTGEITLV